MAALAAVGAMTVLVAHGPRDAPVVPGPAPVFTAAALDDRMVLIRLRAIDAKHISQVHLRAGGGRGSPASHGHGHPRALSPPSGPGRHLTFAQWLARPETRKIQKCESGGNYRLVDVNQTSTGPRTFFGAWQADAEFVRDYAHVNAWDYVHHGEFTMPPAMQDHMAYDGYVDRGDEPWQCR